MNGFIKDLGNGRFRVRWRDLNQQSRSRTFDDIEAAEAFLAEIRLSTVPEPGPTVAEFVEQWFPLKAAEVRPRTAADYESVLRLHVLPALGHRSIASVTPMELAALLRGLDRRAVRVRAVLSLLFAAAVREGLRPGNPVTSLRNGGGKLRRVSNAECPSPENVWALADACPPWARPVVLVAGFAGLRWSEIPPLEVADIDVERMEITVERAFDETTGEVRDPKTAASRRTVVVHPSIRSALADHLPG